MNNVHEVVATSERNTLVFNSKVMMRRAEVVTLEYVMLPIPLAQSTNTNEEAFDLAGCS